MLRTKLKIYSVLSKQFLVEQTILKNTNWKNSTSFFDYNMYLLDSNAYDIWVHLTLNVLLYCSFPIFIPKPHIIFWYSIYCCCSLVTKPYPTLWQLHGLQPTRFSWPWDFPGKNTEVNCHFPLQGIFPTQESNLHLLLGRWILYH